MMIIISCLSTPIGAHWSFDATIVASSPLLSQKNRIYIDGNDTFYIADINNHRIQKLKFSVCREESVVVLVENSGSALTQLSSPSSVVVDSSGYLYIPDKRNDRILRRAPNAAVGETSIEASSGGVSSTLIFNAIVTTVVTSSASISVFKLTSTLFLSTPGESKIVSPLLLIRCIQFSAPIVTATVIPSTSGSGTASLTIAGKSTVFGSTRQTSMEQSSTDTSSAIVTSLLTFDCRRIIRMLLDVHLLL